MKIILSPALKTGKIKSVPWEPVFDLWSENSFYLYFGLDFHPAKVKSVLDPFLFLESVLLQNEPCYYGRWYNLAILSDV